MQRPCRDVKISSLVYAGSLLLVLYLAFGPFACPKPILAVPQYVLALSPILLKGDILWYANKQEKSLTLQDMP